MDISLSLISGAFLAGIAMFFAPCTFPLIPGYLAFISGNTKQRSKWLPTLNAIAFVVGFSTIFILFGVFAGGISSIVGNDYRIIFSRIGGVIILFFGLFMLHIIPSGILGRSFGFRFPQIMKPGSVGGSFALGFSLGFGWTPCIGPILGTILTLAFNSQTASEGALLLTIFSSGLAIPFVLVTLLMQPSMQWMNNIAQWGVWVERIGGIVLIFIGVLLVSDEFGLIIQWGYRILRPFGYEESILQLL